MIKSLGLIVAASLFLAAGSVKTAAQSGAPERFTATAIVNNNVATGAGVVLMQVERWSTDPQRQSLVEVLLERGPDALLKALQKAKSVGSIRTPDSLAYDLRYAHQTKGEDGGRRIVLATDRPIGFWEASRQPRTIDYPFTVVQMEIGADGKGRGTMSYATKIRARGDVIELEDYANQPVMLTEVTSDRK